jgi:hypothetical protein
MLLFFAAAKKSFFAVMAGLVPAIPSNQQCGTR